jgi:hypothetical protein
MTLQYQQQGDDTTAGDENDLSMFSTLSTLDSAKAAFDKALASQENLYPSNGPSSSSDSSTSSTSSVPNYVWPTLAALYRQQTTVYESVDGIYPKPTKVIFGKINVHTAASLGDLASLKELAKVNRSELFKADMNGWRPIHEVSSSSR